MKQFSHAILLATIFFLLLLILPAFQGCINDHRGGYHSLKGTVWNTLYSITFRSDDSAENIEDSINQIMNAVSKSLSVFDSTSLVCRVNTAKEVSVDKHFEYVYNLSRKINILSGGLFDPTAEPLIRAWGFGQGHRPDSDTLRLDSILQFVGIRSTALSNGYLRKKDIRTGFNFSAIAKGYGCDEIGRMFKRNGIKNYMIEIGGEIAVNGISPRGSAWQIAVEGPVALGTDGPNQASLPDLPEYSSVIRMEKGGIATSSNLRNFQKLQGGRVGHVISPVNGRPIATDIISASVIAPSCAEADALATACLTMGSDKAPDMIRKSKAKALIITTDTILRINWPDK